MKLLVTCAFPPAALDELRALGTEVLYEPDLTAERLVSRIRDAAILIVGRTGVSADAVAAARSLQMIVRCGTDVSNIAAEEASAEGVFVTHCPDKEAVAVAELMFGLMLALDRRLLDHAAALRAGAPVPDAALARGLAGQTLGVLGFDAVGHELARRARAFDMKLLAWSASAVGSAPPAGEIEFCSWPRELARRSQIVTAYAPPMRGEGLVVDAALLENLSAGSQLVYVGHGGGIDQTALLDAIHKKSLRVGLDLSAAEGAREALRVQPALLERPGVIVTRQLADRTQQARDATAAEAVRIVRQFLVAGEVLNCVNLLERSPATWQLVLRLRDAVGVLASIMDAIRAEGINAEEIVTRVFVGARAAWCTIALDERPSTETLDVIRGLGGVLHLELRAVV